MLRLSLEGLDLVYKLKVPWEPVKRRETQRRSGEEVVGAGEVIPLSSASLTFSFGAP